MASRLTVKQDGEIVILLELGADSLLKENAGEFIKVFSVHKS